jgi:hypothetical protein
MDPDPNPANLLRTLFIAKSRSSEKADFYVSWMRPVKDFSRYKKRSFGQFLIWNRIQDLDPDSNPGFDSGFESGSKAETNFGPDPKLLFRIRNTDLDILKLCCL